MAVFGVTALAVCSGIKKGGSIEPPLVDCFVRSSVISTRRKMRDKSNYRASKNSLFGGSAVQLIGGFLLGTSMGFCLLAPF